MNVRGICAPGKAQALLEAWASMRYDVVLLQECKADFFTAPAVANQLRGWQIFWAHNTLAPSEPAPADAAAQPLPASPGGTPNQQPPQPGGSQPAAPQQHPAASQQLPAAPQQQPAASGRQHAAPQQQPAAPLPQPAASQQQPAGQQRRSAGVAIAVRQQLLQGHGGSAKVDSDWRTSDGRLISLSLNWGGHSLQLASIYMPNDSAAQRSLIQGSLEAMAQRARPPGQRACTMIWGGDFQLC